MIALVTCREAREVDTDLPLLVSEMPEASIVEWTDPSVDWSQFDRVVLRSPWDYHRRRLEFLAWVERVATVSTLWNPRSLIEWNTDKRYLTEVESWGVPIVPTTFLHDAAAVDHLAAAGGFHGDLVVKPSVGASASGVLATHGDPRAAEAHARSLLAGGLVPMVEPYLAGVELQGETGLVYLGGRFSHAFRRRVVLRPPAELDAGGFGREQSSAIVATPAERMIGDAVVGRLPATAYARIDLLPGDDGPVVLEVELTEPSLFLHLDDGAPARAAAVFRSL